MMNRFRELEEEGDEKKNSLIEQIYLLIDRSIFNTVNAKSGYNQEIIKINGFQKICNSIGSDIEHGLVMTDEQLKRRVQQYGQNRFKTINNKMLVQFIGESILQNLFIIVVLIIQYSIRLFEEGSYYNWIDTSVLTLSVLIIVTVSSVNKYWLQFQQNRISNISFEKQLRVKRNNRVQIIEQGDLVVGDILLINRGDIIRQNGILVKCDDICLDESKTVTRKGLIFKSNNDLLVYANSKVYEGNGQMMVCQMSNFEVVNHNGRQTQLESKVDILNGIVMKIIVIYSFVLIISVLVHKFIRMQNMKLTNEQVVKQYLNSLVIGLSVIVVGIPEGLDLVINMTTRESVDELKSNGCLVRNLDKFEQLGHVDMILTDKTGTLTENSYEVDKVFIHGQVYNASLTESTSNSSFQNYINQSENQGLRRLLVDALSLNSDSDLKLVKNIDGIKQHEFIGNQIECCLLKLLDSIGVDYSQIRQNNKIIKRFPFNSTRKNSISVYQYAEKQSRVIITGASELVLKNCNSFILNNQIIRMDPGMEQNIQDIIQKYSCQQYRTIAVAYNESNPGLIIDHLNKCYNYTLIAIFMLRDPIRPKARETVQQMQNNQINVVMITGDNIHTARSVAKELDMLDQQNQHKQYEVIEATTFRQLLGVVNDEPTNLQQMGLVCNHLKVLARSSPNDKLLLTRIFQKHYRKKVAVTGDDTNDSLALLQADVSFSMGFKASDITKDNADLILLQNNFSVVQKSFLCSRHLHLSVKMFVQNYLISTVPILILNLVSGLYYGILPFSVFQLMFVNIIINVCGSSLLSSPSASQFYLHPEFKFTQIMNHFMIKMVLIYIIYYSAIVVVMFFYGSQITNLLVRQINNLLIKETSSHQVETISDSMNWMEKYQFATVSLHTRLSHHHSFSIIYLIVVCASIINIYVSRLLIQWQCNPFRNVFSWRGGFVVVLIIYMIYRTCIVYPICFGMAILNKQQYLVGLCVILVLYLISQITRLIIPLSLFQKCFKL